MMWGVYMKRVYDHCMNIVKSVIGDNNYKVTCQGMCESEPNNIGVYLYASRDDEECLSGETEWECLKFQLQVTCEKSSDDVFNKLDMVRNIVDKFEECRSTVDGLDILWAKHLGAKARPPFKNGYDLHVCSCVIDFNYILLN